MLFRPTKLISILILVAFWVAGFGNAFGCISCDHGYLSDAHIESHLVGKTHDHAEAHSHDGWDIHTSLTLNEQSSILDQHFHKDGDSCIDAPIQLSCGLIKDANGLDDLVDNVLVDNITWSTVSIQNETFLQSPHFKQKPRISLTILSHRTVALLI